jgi:hypothetical protein
MLDLSLFFGVSTARLPVLRHGEERHKPMLFLLIPQGNEGFRRLRVR